MGSDSPRSPPALFPSRLHSDNLYLANIAFEFRTEYSAAVVQRSTHLDTLFADDGEHQHEIGSPKKLSHLFAKIDQF